MKTNGRNPLVIPRQISEEEEGEEEQGKRNNWREFSLILVRVWPKSRVGKMGNGNTETEARRRH